MNSEIDKALGVVQDIEFNPPVEKKLNPSRTDRTPINVP